jgi:hypothetical protein
VHDGPRGLYVGHLVKADKFETTSHDQNGVWCDGHAYGNVHQGRLRPVHRPHLVPLVRS